MRLSSDGSTFAAILKERVGAAMQYPGTPRPALRGNDADAYLERLMARQPPISSDPPVNSSQHTPEFSNDERN